MSPSGLRRKMPSPEFGIPVEFREARSWRGLWTLLVFQVPKGDGRMRKFTQFAVDFLKREDGPTAVEYAVMLALIIVVCITAISTLGSNANKTFTSVAGVIGGTSS